ncbi:MAG TPA: ABC transporter permease [Puia sp.]|nr:ABC transporter permease [Puia sp.]
MNLTGLAIGIACAGLIFLWVADELQWDSKEVNRDRIYLVKVNVEQDAGTWTHSSTPGPLARVLAAMPGIASTCRTMDGPAPAFRIGDHAVEAAGIYADSSLFDIFTLPFVQGKPQYAFTQLYSLVITESAAKKFFGPRAEKDVIGRRVRMDDKQDYVISGVVKDQPRNSSLQFEWVAPMQVVLNSTDHWNKWDNFGMTTYVEMKPGVSADGFNRRFLEPKYDFTTQKVEKDRSSVHLFLFGMKDWRLYDQFENGKATGGGRITYVRLFSTIAWIVLIIACINFMNLATARSEKRSKEVGVRKVLGAGKPELVRQFLGEALIMAALATLGAMMILELALPAFNALVGKELFLDFGNPLQVGALLGLMVVCGLIAGSYPSLYLSSFNPVFVLKGIRLKTGGAAFIRKVLVVLQFTVSIILIVATIVIYQQIRHVKDRNLGFNRNNLVQLPLHGNMAEHFASVRQDLVNTGVVENAALADHPALEGGNNTGGISWPGKSPDSKVTVSLRLVSPEYIGTMGMHIREGRDFTAADKAGLQRIAIARPEDRPGLLPLFHVVITASMERLMGEGSAIGKELHYDSNFGLQRMIVEGVVDDYRYGDMYGQADPVIFYCTADFMSLVYLRLNPAVAPQQALAQVAAVLKRDNPGYPFTYAFVDEQFNNLFLSEMLISRLSRVFATLAILISCLGLFGLAAYTAERRIKEIGIRKTLGASTMRITRLLTNDFLRLVLLSCLLAFPVAGWIMHNWLQGYAYRIGIHWWVFVVAGMVSVLIAVITVGSQAMRAAVAKPVDSLRSE